MFEFRRDHIFEKSKRSLFYIVEKSKTHYRQPHFPFFSLSLSLSNFQHFFFRPRFLRGESCVWFRSLHQRSFFFPRLITLRYRSGKCNSLSKTTSLTAFYSRPNSIDNNSYFIIRILFSKIINKWFQYRFLLRTIVFTFLSNTAAYHY